MARYIDADKLDDGSFSEVTSEYERGWNDALVGAMLAMPTVDVVEVKRGEWRDGATLVADLRGYPSVICSDCGITFCDIINNHRYMYCYCPNCGAKMDGGGNK